MAFKMKNPEMGKTAKAAGSPHKFGIAGEMKGIDSASRGTKGMDTKSPMKAKRKFNVDVRDEDFVGRGKGGRGTTTTDDKIKAERAEQYGTVTSRQGTKDKYTPKERYLRTEKMLKEDDNISRGFQGGDDAKGLKSRRSNVRVKVKGRKDKSTGKDANNIVTSADSKTARRGRELKDIKKVVMKSGSGARKKKTKIKYDKQGNVKKEVTRVGRLGLRKMDTGKQGERGAGVRVGTREGKDLKGAAAAERIVERKTTANIKGRARREAGDKKA